MNLLQSSEPAVEPVDLPDAKDHCRLRSADHDGLLAGFIVAARRHAEAFLRRRLISQQVQFRRTGLGGSIHLPIAPVQTVDEVIYLDPAENEVTLDANAYRLDRSCHPFRIVPAHGMAWPAVLPDVDTVGISLTVGYGDDATDVPEDIRVALRLLVGHWFEHREPIVTGVMAREMPSATRDLLTPHILWV